MKLLLVLILLLSIGCGKSKSVVEDGSTCYIWFDSVSNSPITTACQSSSRSSCGLSVTNCVDNTEYLCIDTQYTYKVKMPCGYE